MCDHTIQLGRNCSNLVSVNAALTEPEWERAKIASLVCGKKRSEFYANAIVGATDGILQERKRMRPICSAAFPSTFEEAMGDLEEELLVKG